MQLTDKAFWLWHSSLFAPRGTVLKSNVGVTARMRNFGGNARMKRMPGNRNQAMVTFDRI